MKLGFSAWAMREWPVDRQIAIVRDAGYAGICLVSGAEFPLDAARAQTEDAARVREAARQADLEITAVAGHADLLGPDPQASLARVKATLDFAAALAEPGSAPPPVICMGFGTPDTYLSDRDKLVERFGELATHAARHGGVIALEPHVGQAMDLPEKIVWLMQAVNSPHFRLNFDNSHFEVMGRDLDEYVPVLAPYAVHTDLKDQRGRAPDHEFLVPGEGDFSYARYLRAMQRVGYQGFVTVEISVMVQRRADYDPAEVARRSFRTLTDAAREAGVGLEHHGARVVIS